MSYVLHVGANLMCAARLEYALDKRNVAETLYYTPMSDRRLAHTRVGRHHRHAQTVFRVACNVAFYTAFILHEVAPHEGVVAAMGALDEEL